MAMPTLPARAIELARSAPATYARAVATDADGTLWEGDVGDALFLLVAARDAFRPRGAELVRRAAAEYLDPDARSGSDGQIARALYARYEQGLIDVRTMCDLEAAAVGDRARDEFAALMDEIARDAALRVRPEAREVLTEMKRAGASIHVVTGSLGALVEVTMRHADLPFDSVSGGVLRERDGHVLTELDVPPLLFDGKVNSLRASGAWPPALGMGDGGWDHTFLREAHVPLLMHPKPALREALRDVARALTVS